jgi:hypothetical protein
LAARTAGEVTEAGLPLDAVAGVRAVREEGGAVVVVVGSGSYRFLVQG